MEDICFMHKIEILIMIQLRKHKYLAPVDTQSTTIQCSNAIARLIMY